MPVKIHVVSLPITELQDENPLPFFRAREDKAVTDGGLLPEERDGFNWETGFRVLPYRIQDAYAPEFEERSIKTIVLENEFLRASFLPDYGGRLYSLWDKEKSREMLFSNPVLKMGNLALRNAWFSGGIEWNFGHFGHGFQTCAPMFFNQLKDEAGNEFLRMYEFERCKRLFFQMDFHLPPGARHLTVHFRIMNTRNIDVPLFLWTNIAVREEDGCRVFSGTEEVVILVEKPSENVRFLRHGKLPDPLDQGIDHTYPTNIHHAEEYFYQNDADQAWEAIVYPDGEMFYERSSGNYPYRKMFCWGAHEGGKRWQDFLSRPGEGAYLEIQSGLFRSQLHTGPIPAGETISITQLFGGTDVNPAVKDRPYSESRAEIQNIVSGYLDETIVQNEHERCLNLAQKPGGVPLHRGSGWGALEQRRDAGFVPVHLTFLSETITEEQAGWEKLIRQEPFAASGSFMTGQEWISLMEQSLSSNPDQPELWTHLGIAAYEEKEYERAMECWQKSLALRPVPLALRNLALLDVAKNDFEAAIQRMDAAVELLPTINRAYAEEYLLWLKQAQNYTKADQFYQSLPEALKTGERVQLNYARSAFELGKKDFLEALFERNFSTIREGETEITDLWVEFQAKIVAERRGVAYTETFLKEITPTIIIPRRLDFRLVNK